jgi:hypothetical protein
MHSDVNVNAYMPSNIPKRPRTIGAQVLQRKSSSGMDAAATATLRTAPLVLDEPSTLSQFVRTTPQPSRVLTDYVLSPTAESDRIVRRRGVTFFEIRISRDALV